MISENCTNEGAVITYSLINLISERFFGHHQYDNEGLTVILLFVKKANVQNNIWVTSRGKYSSSAMGSGHL